MMKSEIYMDKKEEEEEEGLLSFVPPSLVRVHITLKLFCSFHLPKIEFVRLIGG
jgi:hypothetical protein